MRPPNTAAGGNTGAIWFIPWVNWAAIFKASAGILLLTIMETPKPYRLQWPMLDWSAWN